MRYTALVRNPLFLSVVIIVVVLLLMSTLTTGHMLHDSLKYALRKVISKNESKINVVA